MPTYELGQTLQFGLLTTSDGTTLADLGGGLPTATITKPDGTTSAGSVAKTATGTYTATLASTLAGRYRCAWTGSGANSGGLPYTEVADVWPADPRLIISLADARSALNIPATQRVNDDELRQYVAQATVVVEHLAGPQLAATRVETHDGGRSAICLHEFPTAVTSVVESGTTLASTDYCWTSAGILWRSAYPGGGSWAFGARNVVVTYSVGGAILSPAVIGASRELVRHWWTQSQQPTRGAYSPPADDYTSTMVAGYAVPNSVVDKLAAVDNRTPGIA